jgi:hypothetical protein
VSQFIYFKNDRTDEKQPANDGKNVREAAERCIHEMIEPFVVVSESLIAPDWKADKPNWNEDNRFDKRPKTPSPPFCQRLFHDGEDRLGLPQYGLETGFIT